MCWNVSDITLHHFIMLWEEWDVPLQFSWCDFQNMNDSSARLIRSQEGHGRIFQKKKKKTHAADVAVPILTPGSLWCTTIFPINSKKSFKRQFCRETSWQKPNHGADDAAPIELAAFLERRRKFSIMERYHRCSSATDMDTKKGVKS